MVDTLLGRTFSFYLDTYDSVVDTVFGESEKDKKIKETNKRIEQLEKEVSSLKIQQQSSDDADRIEELENQINACAMGIEPACIP
jgi:chaperonin cofactor prefoldin|tara:strand:+ start:356 stop:610 length:255 start_codon:yes stop_codon:yes gene_type:complete